MSKYWKKTDLFCPKCGQQTVIILPDVEEDNAGVQHICFRCVFGFFHPQEHISYLDLEPHELVKVIEQAQDKYFTKVQK